MGVIPGDTYAERAIAGTLAGREDTSDDYVSPGGGGDGEGGSVSDSYVHTQSSPSSTWSITHDLNRYPAVVVADDSGNSVIATVQYPDVDSAEITFSEPFSGKAYFS